MLRFLSYDYRDADDVRVTMLYEADRIIMWDNDEPAFTIERYGTSGRWIIVEIHDSHAQQFADEITSDPNGDLIVFRDPDVATEHYSEVLTSKR